MRDRGVRRGTGPRCAGAASVLAGARVPVMLVLLDDEHAAARPAIAVRILGRQRVDRGPATEESDLASLVKLLGAELREARNAGGSGQRGTLAVVEPRQWAVMDRDGMGGSASWTATNGRPCLSGEPPYPRPGRFPAQRVNGPAGALACRRTSAASAAVVRQPRGARDPCSVEELDDLAVTIALAVERVSSRSPQAARSWLKSSPPRVSRTQPPLPARFTRARNESWSSSVFRDRHAEVADEGATRRARTAIVTGEVGRLVDGPLALPAGNVRAGRRLGRWRRRGPAAGRRHLELAVVRPADVPHLGGLVRKGDLDGMGRRIRTRRPLARGHRGDPLQVDRRSLGSSVPDLGHPGTVHIRVLLERQAA